ncbi:hypothetical protein MN116_007667 [Schistosoma mekongi]|uniref:SCP domain-containing protein n=1 Tax=Schistosoma mekongi TaxID=38744 RepID=A0AAE1Z7C9_SCHME|nr:hypothetical protein MN116_007667 [Schistosoma mekongi]
MVRHKIKSIIVALRVREQQLDLLNLLHNKLRNDSHDSRVSGQPQSKYSKILMWNNTLQQYAESHVKHCNPNVTLARQHYNNSMSVNVDDRGDVMSIRMMTLRAVGDEVGHVGCKQLVTVTD